MQFGDILCYALLTFTVAATCVMGEEQNTKQELEEERTRKISKREASVIIDNFPVEPVYSQTPKMIFRRVSRQRYGPPKSKYGPPKPKYGPPSKTRKPSKKYRTHGPRPKSRSPKPRYGPPKRGRKPSHGHKKKPHAPSPQYLPQYNSEPVGFGEPPADYDHQPAKHNYADSPVDSYGAPLKTVGETYPSTSYSENINHYEHPENSNFEPEYQSWQNYQREVSHDSSSAYSKKRPLFTKPDELFDGQVEDDENYNLQPYADFSYHNYNEPAYMHNRNKRPQYFADSNKNMNKYWNAPKVRPEKIKVESDDEMLVGGQYAEPPARYVPKFQPSAPMFTGSLDDFAPPQSFVDSDIAATSATNSRYVNYKNSNMAFSPQNLNDAFSIVDK